MPCQSLGRGCREEREGLFHLLAKRWSYTLAEFTAVFFTSANIWEEGALALQWYGATQGAEHLTFSVTARSQRIT